MGKREGRPKFLFLFFNQTEQKVIQSNSISFFGLYQIYAQSIIHSIPLKIKSTKFKPPPFASICRLLYRPSPSAKTLFNAVRQCYFEMKTNKELCFSILSIIILWSGCNSIGFCARHIQLHTYTLYSTGSILCRDSAYFWWSHCDLLKIL